MTDLTSDRHPVYDGFYQPTPAYLATIEDIDRRHALVMYTGTDLRIIRDGDHRRPLSTSAFRREMNQIRLPDPYTGKMRGAGDLWFEYPNRNTGHDLIFDPVKTYPLCPARHAESHPGHSRERDFNTYRGPARREPGDWSAIEAAIHDLVAGGEETLFNDLLDRMAHRVQKPEVNPMNLIGLTGDASATKDWFANDVLGALVHPAHHLIIDDAKVLHARFNAELDSRLIIHVRGCPVGDHNDRPGNNMQVLRALAKSRNLRVEHRYVRLLQMNNPVQVVVSINGPVAWNTHWWAFVKPKVGYLPPVTPRAAAAMAHDLAQRLDVEDFIHPPYILAA